MDIALAHRAVTEYAGSKVERIPDGVWGDRTPCSEWDLRDLVHHMVYGSVWVAPLVEGMTIAEVGDRFEGDLLGEDPRAAWRTASIEACVAFEADGALDRTVDLSSGPTPAREYAEERVLDLLCHGWDVARAIAVDDRMPDDLVEVGFAVLGPREAGWRRSGALGPVVPIPENADRQTELLAHLGRRATEPVGW